MNLTPLEVFAIKYSIKIAVLSVIINIPLCLLVILIIKKLPKSFKILIETILSLPIVLPPIVTGYILLIMFSKNSFLGNAIYSCSGITIPFSFYGSVLAATVISFPIMLKPIKLSYENIDIMYIKISMNLGISKFKTFFKITLPLIKNGLISGALLGFARALGEFGATIMLAGNIPFKTTSIPLAIFSFFNQANGENSVFRLVIISIIISLVSLILSEILVRKSK